MTLQHLDGICGLKYMMNQERFKELAVFFFFKYVSVDKNQVNISHDFYNNAKKKS